MITASVGVDSSLLLEPARELLFPLPARGRSRCCLTLSNLSLSNDVVFRVRTRKPDAFTVRPTHGLLAPGTSVQVVLSATDKTCSRLSAMSPHDLAARQSSELFLVQSVEREEDMRLAQTLDADSTASLRAFWHKVPREVITENKLVCRFTATAPPLPPLASSNWASSSGSGSSPMAIDGRRRRTASSSNSYRSSIASDDFQSMISSSDNGTYSADGDVAGGPSRSRRSSLASDTSSSFQTTIEGPPPNGRSSISRMSSVSSVQQSLRDTVLTSFSVHDSEVSNDTMLSMDSTDSSDTIDDGANDDDAAHTPGPLLYSVHPSDTLTFQVQPASRFWGHSSFYVVNASQTDCLAFKVRTSNQQGYVVKPSRGLVATTSAQKVEVSLCAPRADQPFDAAKREANDAFLIEVANISTHKYCDLASLDERRRTRELSALWAILPSTGRGSSMLTVELAVEGSHADTDRRSVSSSVGVAPSARGRSSATSERDERYEEQRRTVGSVIERMRKLSTVTAMEPPLERRPETAKPVGSSSSHDDTSSSRAAESQVPNRGGSRSESCSGSDTDSDYDYGDGGGAASQMPRQSAVVVVSADRMDTVDFSNPEVTFFM